VTGQPGAGGAGAEARRNEGVMTGGALKPRGKFMRTALKPAIPHPQPPPLVFVASIASAWHLGDQGEALARRVKERRLPVRLDPLDPLGEVQHEAPKFKAVGRYEVLVTFRLASHMLRTCLYIKLYYIIL